MKWWSNIQLGLFQQLLDVSVVPWKSNWKQISLAVEYASSSAAKFGRASCCCSAPYLLTRDFKLHTQWSSHHYSRLKMHNRDLISLELFLMKFCVVQSIWITFLGGQKKKRRCKERSGAVWKYSLRSLSKIQIRYDM